MSKDSSFSGFWGLAYPKVAKNTDAIHAAIKKEQQLKKSLRLPKGVRLYRYEKDTDTMIEIDLKEGRKKAFITFTDSGGYKITFHHAITDSNNYEFYLAINERNARKKMKKLNLEK
jgi:hypothetical protein